MSVGSVLNNKRNRNRNINDNIDENQTTTNHHAFCVNDLQTHRCRASGQCATARQLNITLAYRSTTPLVMSEFSVGDKVWYVELAGMSSVPSAQL